jgi:hypothetical protein
MPGPPPGAAACVVGERDMDVEAGACVVGARGAGGIEVVAGAGAGCGAGIAEPVDTAPPVACAALLIPPWPLQAPRPPCAEVVPSLQATGPDVLVEADGAAPAAAVGLVVAADGLAGGGLELAGAVVAPAAAAPPEAAFVAALSMPPWPLQAPRPPCGELVPSLQVTGVVVSAAALTPGSANSAAAANAPYTSESSLLSPMSLIGGTSTDLMLLCSGRRLTTAHPRIAAQLCRKRFASPASAVLTSP